ncbi:hypothetical protein F5X68DRAFT_203090 [Plectosphaerella plurivora]|uniref:Uncharacterized protein n=1 Tax=Plectosphaerella plurivora TaxID=936078 RepID=A0A9P9AAC6_9PEZI|nr:hypothetical protein F5X68DRAFT_203090 [Plectosphaerella plurivora]
MAGSCFPNDCPVPGGFLRYQPSKEGNAVILAAFAALIPVTLGLGYRFRAPTFALLLTAGLLMEVVGFSARVLMHNSLADTTYFTLFLVGTALGPTLVAAAVFSILPHALTIYGKHVCPVRPRQVAFASASLVVIVGLLEVVGSVLIPFRVAGLKMSDSALILVAGLIVQAVALVLFVGVHLWITICLTGEQVRLDLKYAPIYESSQFRRFLLVMQIGALLLFGHTIYRAIEVASGISGPVFQNQVAFMIANGALPLTVCVLLCVFSPGAAFGRAWGPTSPLRHGKRSPRPPPLSSPMVPYEATQSPRRTGGGDSKQQTPTTASSLPLQSSTMATSVRYNPATQTMAQQSPGSAPKNSPTHWREQRRLSAWPLNDSGSVPTQPSPQTSPTFELRVPHSEQSPTFLAQQQHQQSARTDGRRNSRPAQTPGNLVQEDTLW